MSENNLQGRKKTRKHKNTSAFILSSATATCTGHTGEFLSPLKNYGHFMIIYKSYCTLVQYVNIYEQTEQLVSCTWTAVLRLAVKKNSSVDFSSDSVCVEAASTRTRVFL